MIAKEAQSTETECQAGAPCGVRQDLRIGQPRVIIDGRMEIFPAFSSFLATAFDASKKRSQTPAFAQRARSVWRCFSLPVPFGQIAPMGAGTERPKDAADEREAVVSCCLAWIKRLAQQERSQPLPWHPRQLVRFAFPRATK